MLSVPLWLIRALDGLDPNDPPLAPQPDIDNLPGPDRALVYEDRLAAGQAVFHPGDLAREHLDTRAVQETHRRRNGSDAEGDWLLLVVVEPDDAELLDEIRADLFFRPRSCNGGTTRANRHQR